MDIIPNSENWEKLCAYLYNRRREIIKTFDIDYFFIARTYFDRAEECIFWSLDTEPKKLFAKYLEKYAWASSDNNVDLICGTRKYTDLRNELDCKDCRLNMSVNAGIFMEKELLTKDFPALKEKCAKDHIDWMNLILNTEYPLTGLLNILKDIFEIVEQHNCDFKYNSALCPPPTPAGSPFVTNIAAATAALNVWDTNNNNDGFIDNNDDVANGFINVVD